MLAANGQKNGERNAHTEFAHGPIFGPLRGPGFAATGRAQFCGRKRVTHSRVTRFRPQNCVRPVAAVLGPRLGRGAKDTSGLSLGLSVSNCSSKRKHVVRLHDVHDMVTHYVLHANTCDGHMAQGRQAHESHASKKGVPETGAN